MLVVKKQHTQRMSVAEMRLLRRMSSVARKNQLKNEFIRNRLGVIPISDKLRKNRLKWYGHVLR